MKKLTKATLSLLLLPSILLFQKIELAAQISFPKAAPSDPREACYAFTNATIYLDFKTRQEGATLVIREGKVEACGAGVRPPADAVVMDCSGKTIYPAFIDCYAAGYGLPELRTTGGGGFGPRQGGQTPQPPAQPKGVFSWNEALKTDFNAVENFSTDAKAAEEYRKIGFAAIQTFRADGISRGTGALLNLTDEREHEAVLIGQSAHFLSFRKGASSTPYPTSLMGIIALLRQSYMDGQWYKTEGFKQEKNLSIEAWNTVQALPQFFEAGEKYDILRAAKIGQEFGAKYILKTAGDEYQRLEEVKATGLPLILGLNFPESPDVRDPLAALEASLKDLKHWELAPTNPAQIEAAGIPFALTTMGLKEKSKFWDNLRKAIEYGLTEQAALKALTFQPATFLNAYDKIGSLETGKAANFIIVEGNVFEKNSKIFQTWSGGKQFVIKDLADVFPKNLHGEWSLVLEGDMVFQMNVATKDDELEVKILRSEKDKPKVNFSFQNGLVALSWQADSTSKNVYALAGSLSGNEMAGRGTTPDGRWISWRAVHVAPPAAPAAPTKQNPVKEPEVGAVVYPFCAFGRVEKPKQEAVLIKNATVWTNEKEGILTGADVLVVGGKIQQVGKNLSARQNNATIVDGTGKHLTAGIIDEHSHIAATRSINEGTQESSAEVRIGDVIDPDDIDIYRQLSGGVTSSHILHGSSNPIGGQTQLLKLRWGAGPEEMKFQNWPGQIKFALGENVKGSNWEGGRNRYPQTRMGVEQVYDDYFTRAREYGMMKKSGKPMRKDLELEALLEILESKRFITCHSYVQSEITMMMRVAERFGFKMNTFTHILEGYKVADKMAKHGAGASSFADWWAYKWEVYSAIPHSPKMMADQGVVVAINSDDAEMARRLNQEAAKSVMYAGMKEEEAWKMVTLNPAKLLRVDDRVGSIRAGKDADLVLWNEHPLSVYAKAEKTWVDGALYFDRVEDARLRELVQQERNRLIQKVLSSKKGGDREGFGPPSAPKRHYHCDSEEDEG